MIRSYWDVDEVLLAEQTVPVEFHCAMFSLGKELVVRSAEGERLREVTAGSQAALPMWAAAPLCRSRFASVQLGKMQEYSMNVFRSFKMDPLAPNLRAKGSYYYEHGTAASALLPSPNDSDGIRLRKQLQRLFQIRFFPILKATSRKGHDFQELRDTLGESERRLLDAVWQGERNEKAWWRFKLF